MVAKFKILLVLMVALGGSVYANNETSSNLWDQIVKMEQIVLSVEYHGRRLNVWKEEVHGYNRFFVTPICVMDTSSVKCTQDKYSNFNRFALKFYIQLWDSDAAKVVQLSLKQKGFEVEASDIIPLPMQMVKLSINRDVALSSEIKLDNNNWKPHQTQQNRILFEFGLENQTFCNEMVSHAKSDPVDFLEELKLNFKFTMVVNEKASRNLNITGKTISNSKIFANLENLYSNKTTGFMYLQSEDVNDLSRDIYRTLTISDEITGDYIETEKENQIILELFNEIKGQQIFSAELAKDEWNSVFWDDIFARPDIQTEYFNDTLTYDSDTKHFKYDEAKDMEFREKIKNRYFKERGNKIGGGGGFSFLGLGGNVNLDSVNHDKDINEGSSDVESKNVTIVSTDELEKFIELKKANVKLTGTTFMPKNLALQRINTKALQSSGQILYKKVITTKLATTQELQIQAEPEYVSGYNESVNFVYFEVLQTAMENITATLKAYIEERVTDITISFEAHVKSRLNNATETFKRQMEDHIDNATSNLQIYIENLDQQIYTLSNQTNNRIATTKTECENTKKKLSSLVECSNARIPVVYGKGGYGSNEAVNRLISAIGDGPKKLFDKSYVRLVAAAGDPRIFTIKCWSNDVTLDTVVLTDGSEMAFEFSYCIWGLTRFWCDVSINGGGRRKHWEVYSYDPQNKAHNWLLFDDAIYRGAHDGSKRDRVFDWDH